MGTSRNGGLARLQGVQPFEEIVSRHGAMVLRVCRAIVGPDEAEDAWSETFLAAMAAYPELPPTSNVVAWLVTIAKRKAVDQHRQRARRAQPVADVPESDAGPTVDAADRVTLWTALAGLSERQREAVAFHHLAGLPYAEVAAVIGGSEDAVRRAAADGLRRLRETFREER